MNQNDILKNLSDRTSHAVAHYWNTRYSQRNKQKQSGKADQGSRGDATGGAQMAGFIDLFTELIVKAGIPEEFIFRNKGSVVLPGFFRPTKEWDLLVVRNNMLVAAIEAKSHVGSFGNNFNNRTEEAIGSALDLWTAFRERAYLKSPQPFLGYFFMLEDNVKSIRPVKAKNHISKFFRSLLTHHMHADMNYFAENLSSSVIIHHQRLSLHPQKRGKMVYITLRQTIYRLTVLQKHLYLM